MPVVQEEVPGLGPGAPHSQVQGSNPGQQGQQQEVRHHVLGAVQGQALQQWQGGQEPQVNSHSSSLQLLLSVLNLEHCSSSSPSSSSRGSLSHRQFHRCVQGERVGQK
jgi:hypothetical protein